MKLSKSMSATGRRLVRAFIARTVRARFRRCLRPHPIASTTTRCRRARSSSGARPGQWIVGKPPFTILDFGCGPGRDLKVFSELGHIAVGLEGAAHFAVMARTHSGCEVWQQDFLKLDLANNHFDGVYANASLFHVPSQELTARVAGTARQPETGWCAV